MAGRGKTSGVTIREFRPGDYESILALWQSAQLPLKPRGRDSRENIERQVAEPTAFFLVAETSAGQIAGTV
ncbi:MAG: hypothetical protein OEW05_05225, partial [Candidatus Aminicenantes bacterium]|nr:hypothetical protein [Candidatus Aminicenantes bacterium]